MIMRQAYSDGYNDALRDVITWAESREDYSFSIMGIKRRSFIALLKFFLKYAHRLVIEKDNLKTEVEVIKKGTRKELVEIRLWKKGENYDI